MPIQFHKLHGAGNDFILLDLRRQQLALDPATARQLADRHTGIGCDQLLVLLPPTATDHLARFEIWTSDGSTAQQCGNGMRAIGLYLNGRGEALAGGFSLRGPAGDVHSRCLDDGQVQVDMGWPQFEPDQVPLALAAQDGWYTLDIQGRQVRFGAASMGNPHAVVPVTHLDDAMVETLGPAISRHPAFPEGCNVGFALVEAPDRLRLRVWERGAGETRACGSGACAAVAVLSQLGLAGSRVGVQQAGGVLIIEWNGGDGPVLMTGPAVHVFDGTLA
jgi:diaminopimelate epimerase